MDHLPPVLQPHKPVVVKYLGGEYGGLEQGGYGFTNFPFSQAVKDVESGAPTISQETMEEAARVLQVRFFFGMIREVLDLPVTQSDFIRQEDGQQFITTAKLRDYLRRWRDDIEQMKKDETGQQLELRNERTVNCLQEAIDTWRSFPNFTSIVGGEIELSIQILGSTFEHALDLVAGIPVEYLPWRHTRSAFLDDQMLADGWCPALIWQISTPCRLVFQYYVSLLGPHGIKHTKEAKCKAGDTACDLVANQDSPQDRTSRHICQEQERTTCRDVRPLLPDKVNELIEAGYIPILEYDPDKAELHVRPYTEGDQYTAISHVWTDGLGNFDGNSMPKCQLERLNNLIKEIPWTNKCLATLAHADKTWPLAYNPDINVNNVQEYGPDDFVDLAPDPEQNKSRPHLFWIDTICVPRPFDPLTELTNKMAINDMRLVYILANKVLVLDSDIINVKGDLCAEEVLARISCTNWIRRFWTLQEAALAKTCWFQFGDNCYTPLKDTEGLHATYDNEVSYYCKDFNFGWRESALYTPPLRRVTIVWDNLKFRSSYKPEDQPICIATLLDMPLDDIQTIPKQERFRKLWLFYECLPIGLIFALVPREQESPFRWAPIALDGLTALPFQGTSKEIFPTSNGLKVAHLGIMTTSRLTKNRKGVIAFDIGDGVYLARENTKLRNPPWGGIDFTVFPRMAVILAIESFHDATGELFQRALGALVGVIEVPATGDGHIHGTGVIKCQYLRVVSVLLQGKKWEHVGQAWTEQDEDEKKLTTPSAFLPLEQKWLIT